MHKLTTYVGTDSTVAWYYTECWQIGDKTALVATESRIRDISEDED